MSVEGGQGPSFWKPGRNFRFQVAIRSLFSCRAMRGRAIRAAGGRFAPGAAHGAPARVQPGTAGPSRGTPRARPRPRLRRCGLKSHRREKGPAADGTPRSPRPTPPRVRGRGGHGGMIRTGHRPGPVPRTRGGNSENTPAARSRKNTPVFGVGQLGRGGGGAKLWGARARLMSMARIRPAGTVRAGHNSAGLASGDDMIAPPTLVHRQGPLSTPADGRPPPARPNNLRGSDGLSSESLHGGPGPPGKRVGTCSPPG